MEQATTSSKRLSTNALDKNTSRYSWIDEHAELITKVEAAYESPFDTKVGASVIRQYGFSIGGLNILLAENSSCEILEENDIHSIPLAPSWLVGASNVRGDVVPIIDLEHTLTGKIRSIELHTYKTFIIGEGENALGLLLNTLPAPTQFKKEHQLNDFSELPKPIRPFVTIAYKRDQEVWVCIDFASLFASLTNQ